MNKASSPIAYLGVCLGTVLSLLFALIPPGVGAPPEPGDRPAPTALARIELSTEADLVALADMDISIYTQLYTPRGDRILILPVDKGQYADLSGKGFPIQLLNTYQAEPDPTYQLLYGLPEALNRVGSQIDLLVVEGRQAVAQVTPDQIRILADSGIKTFPLSLQPLVAPTTNERSTLSIPSIAYNPLIEAMISQVDPNSLYTRVGNLSGEWPVVIDASPYTIATRYTVTDVPIKKATKYTYNTFTSLGIPAGYDYYPLYGYEKRSVLAEQTGVTQPDRILLLTAHLDSTSHLNGDPSTFAPGADDNASGSAALMYIAELLSQYNFGCTLRYALFTGEEQGIYGSKAYAADVYARGENLAAVLNLDMLGYNTSGSQPAIELHTRPGNSGDLSIANLFAEVISLYNINLVPQILQDGLTFSDHSSFWNYGYPAIIAMEDWDDHTPYYHTRYDQLETLNMAYYTEFVKASLAAFAHMGCLTEPGLTGAVKDAASSEPVSGASVEVRLDDVLVGESHTNQAGAYFVPLPSEDYTVTFLSADHRTEKMEDVHIAPNQVTPLNISLQPCTTVKDVSFSFTPFTPQTQESISFTSTVGAGAPPLSYIWDFGDGNAATGQGTAHAYDSKGGYTTNLTVDNACLNPKTFQTTIIVDAELIFLPLVASGVQP